MKKLKSYCKINTFLDVGKIINSQKLHNIKSLIFILNLHDEILIEKKNMIKDKISFHGKFKSKIKKKIIQFRKHYHSLDRSNILKIMKTLI